MSHPHPCLDCGEAADLPQVYETGEMYGWRCAPCDRKRRRKEMRWRKRISIRLRRWLQL